MKKLLIAIAFAFALPMAGSAPAADASPISGALSAKESKCAEAKRQGKPCKISFGQGSDIEATPMGPDGDDMIAQIEALFGGLIDLRYDFRDAIIAAADDV